MFSELSVCLDSTAAQRAESALEHSSINSRSFELKWLCMIVAAIAEVLKT